MTFHNIMFPMPVSMRAKGGAERRTDVVTLASGRERRNSRWALSRHHYDAGTGIRTLDDLHLVLEFFEERRGRLYGFRYRDPVDHKSCAPSQTITAFDQRIGTGDGTQTEFQLVKVYGGAFDPYSRAITKPVAGSVLIALDNAALDSADYDVDINTGIVTLASAPPNGSAITAGFLFDVPVRFETDRLDIDLQAFQAGSVPTIPLVELL